MSLAAVTVATAAVAIVPARVRRLADRTPLTRRGWGVVALLAVCLVFAQQFGARTLNAVVAPGVVALVAAVLVVGRVDPPTVRRRRSPDGYPGETHAVALQVAGDRLGVYTVRDGVPEALTARPRELTVADAEATVEYDLTYDRRGAFDLDPVEVEVSDVLGLAARTYEVEADAGELLVYPTVASPSADVRSSIEGVRDRRHAHGREEFDSLREYDRGDALRDVHWKSSAKRPDDELVVKQFHEDATEEAVGVAVGARGGVYTVDAAASAAASLATYLLDDGVEVGIETPVETVEPGTGEEHRRRLLAALARLTSGSLPATTDAELRVTASNGEASVLVGDRTIPFDPGRTAGGGGQYGHSNAGAGSGSRGGSGPGSGSATGDGDDERSRWRAVVP